MQFVLHQVNVTNWSKDPLLKMDEPSKAKLGKAILYSRQIVDDSLTLLRNYQRKKQIAQHDAQMAADYFSATESSIVEEALPKYFGLDMNSAAILTDLSTLITNFGKIKAGIDGAFDLVVGNIHDGDDVRDGLSEAFDSLKKGKFKEAINDLKFIRKGTEGWVHPGHDQKRIHLNINSIKSEPAGKIARIIVHEASHKFAGTIDVAYKWDQLKNNVGGHAGLTNNADSYAWGGRLMWKRKRRLPSGV